MSVLQAIADSRFADAYDSVPGWARARLKKAVADVWSWSGAVAWNQDCRQTGFPSGTQVLHLRQPRDWCLVAARAEVGPGAILGAVLPPVLSGVREVAVLWLGGAGRLLDSSLLALELSGIERVYSCRPEQMEAGIEELSRLFEGPRGWVLRLGQSHGERFSGGPGKRRVESELTVPQTAGIFVDEQDLCDFDALQLAHPGLAVQVWNAVDERLPSQWSVIQGSWGEFLNSDFDLALVGKGRAEEALRRFPVVLSPGHEVTWIWPDYPWQMCFVDRLGWIQEG